MVAELGYLELHCCLRLTSKVYGNITEVYLTRLIYTSNKIFLGGEGIIFWETLYLREIEDQHTWDICDKMQKSSTS